MMDNKVLVLNRMQTDDIEYKLNELAKDGWTVAAATPDLVYLHREVRPKSGLPIKISGTNEISFGSGL